MLYECVNKIRNRYRNESLDKSVMLKRIKYSLNIPHGIIKPLKACRRNEGHVFKGPPCPREDIGDPFSNFAR